MGNTTIIEINHDFACEIFNSISAQEDFLEQLSEQINNFKYTGKRIRGGVVVAGFHRSGTIYDRWIKFKHKMGWDAW